MFQSMPRQTSNHAMERTTDRRVSMFLNDFDTFTPSTARPRRARIATAKRLRAGPPSLILFSLGP